jgi:hypothetical protein
MALALGPKRWHSSLGHRSLLKSLVGRALGPTSFLLIGMFFVMKHWPVAFREL